ncbi:MAG: hypothetical protein COY42_10580 [Armatimonadetes bacterium CG_4_10_14_0_8_um_filter_66_14]|nr:hypothetical protein [Armatimonadota bacterium]OIP11864.1 MAG: hypothetical protein AUJ96_01345 [Armatimonadetes bacterium CG2_30_66_41]PIY48300.1 MAG: hypothetical protein COZ05_03530 [Armatimonadetes bacterium CG_4_10_14_3_um_filter_59_10]PIZ46519.1 MAG: hypothetical protein COY42_10580 [Armatimonadetes bacterium CG_4_10_14_0_8_um_filter_66_14]
MSTNPNAPPPSALERGSRGKPGGLKALPNAAVFVSVTILVFATRVPFLSAGYGNDIDAWGVANTARHIATTHHYATSRFPGYPVQEFICSLIWRGGPSVLNGATAILGAMGVAFFALSIRTLGSSDVLLGSLALALTPVVYINSTNSLDYVWAMAFTLASLHFVLSRRLMAAGVLLGLAIGCRITSGAMLLPLSVMLYSPVQKRRSARDALLFAAFTIATGTVAFSPVIFTWGTRFLTFYFTGYPNMPTVLRRATLDVWGIVGLVAILAAIALSWLWRGAGERTTSIPGSTPRSYTVAWILTVLLYVMAFVRLPYEPGYLVPMVPFIILLLGRRVRRRAFQFACAGVLVSSFVGIGKAGVEWGPIFQDYGARLSELRYVDSVAAAASSLQHRAFVVSGHWMPMLQAQSMTERSAGVKYVYYADEPQLRRHLAHGARIYYLRGQEQSNLAATGLDVRKVGAQPLPVQ